MCLWSAYLRLCCEALALLVVCMMVVCFARCLVRVSYIVVSAYRDRDGPSSVTRSSDLVDHRGVAVSRLSYSAERMCREGLRLEGYGGAGYLAVSMGYPTG